MFKYLSLAAATFAVAACADIDPAATQEGPAKNAQGQGWSVNPSTDLNRLFNCLEDEAVTLVSAHRGGAYPGYPENALETIAHIIERAPALIEVDVATSADGVLFLMHDDTLNRTTTGSGEVSSLYWNDIKDLRLIDDDGGRTSFHPPLFADVLEFAKSRTIMQIDFKRSTRYEDVVNEVKRQNADDRVIYIAYSMAAARKLHRLHPKAMISLSVNSQSDLNRAVASGIPANRLIGFTGTEDPRPRLFDILNDRDVEVIFGTLGGRSSIDRAIARSGSEAEYGQLASQGIDIIATDRPLEAHRALVQSGRGAQNGTCGIFQNG